jgi:Tfp pilus assembly protein PilO
MTTSFTSTEEFGTQLGDDFNEGPDYPSAFGITFTPKVTGIAIGIIGVMIAAYLVFTQVFPAMGEVSKLRQTKKENERTFEQLKNSRLEVVLQTKKAELQEAQEIKQEVANLFSNRETLKTLLLNINGFVNATNVTLNSYTPGPEEVVEDNFFGELATGKIQKKNYNLNVEGNFAQIQSFLQNIERLQPLLIVTNFNANLSQRQNYSFQDNQVVITGEPILQTTMSVDAISLAPPTPTVETEEQAE